MEQEPGAAPARVREKNGSEDLELSSALNHKLRLRQSLLKINHHLTFLENFTRADVVPKGLRIQHEVHFMDANNTTHANIESILKRSERDVGKALIGHYEMLQAETRIHLKTAEKEIRDHLDRDSPDIPASYKTFQTQHKNIQNNTLQNSLEKRDKLSPTHTNISCTHTVHIQCRSAAS